MKLKLDENLPESLVAELAGLGHDADNVRQEGLAGFADPDVWAAAQAEGRFLLTQDLDFSDVRQFQPGHASRHPPRALARSGPLGADPADRRGLSPGRCGVVAGLLCGAQWAQAAGDPASGCFVGG